MNWKIKDKSITSLENYFLQNMGVQTLDEVNDFFRKSKLGDYQVSNLAEAVDLCDSLKNRPIYIMGDFDVDGQCSVAILYLTFKALGYKNVTYLIPRRFTDGFGIKVSMIDQITEEEALIVTVDNGIAQYEEIAYAKDKGHKVIIIDHHLPACVDGKEIIPAADVIVDPHVISGSTFDGYCGAGLSYKFALSLLRKSNPDFKEKSIFHYHIKALAAIATVADVMELKEENYVFVRQGLSILSKRFVFPALGHLLDVLNLSDDISSTDIGFTLAPVLNAASRMSDSGSLDAISLLISTKSEEFAIDTTNLLIDRNNERKESKKYALDIAEKQIFNNGITYPLVLYIPNIHEGIVGIVAGALSEKYRVPSFVVTDSSTENLLKGSARGVDGYNVKEHLDLCAEFLFQYGGHEGAAGLQVLKKDLNRLRKALIKCSKDFNFNDNEIDYFDFELSPDDVPNAISELKKFAPFGTGNPEPIFKLKGFIPISDKKLLGSGTVKFTDASGLSALGFDMAKKFDGIIKPEKITFYGTLSENHFRGTVTPQMIIKDFV